MFPDPFYAASHAAAEEERVVGLLLARANLLRLRGQFDEAAVACTEALRLVPNSPSACSLLGGIYEAQRRLDDALQWYSMAVEFDPANVNNRANLERVAQTQRHALQREEHAAEQRARRTVPAAAARSLPAGDRTSSAQQTLQWFDRLFPPGRWDSAARLILLLCGAMAFILLFAAGFVYLSSRDEARVPGSNALLDAPPGVGQNVIVMPPAPVSIPAPPAPVPAPPAPVPAPAPSVAASSGLNPVASAGTGGAVSPAPASGPPPPLSVPVAETTSFPANNDPALLDALRVAFTSAPFGSSAQVTAAEVDERVPQISLSLLLPAPGAGEPAASVRERVLRAAAQAVRVAGERRPRIDRALVRVQFAPLPSNNGAVPTPAFFGETATTAVRAAGGETARGAALRALFLNPVWGSGLGL